MEYKDLITTINARPEFVNFSELHSLMLRHEFLYGEKLASLLIIASNTEYVTFIAEANQVQYFAPIMDHLESFSYG